MNVFFGSTLGNSKTENNEVLFEYPPLTLKMARCYLVPRLVLARKTNGGREVFWSSSPIWRKRKQSLQSMVFGFHVQIFRILGGFIGVFGMVFFCHPQICSTQDLRQYPRVLWSRQSLVSGMWLFRDLRWRLTGLEKCQEHYAANLAVQPNQHRCIAFENPGLQAFDRFCKFAQHIWALGFCYAAFFDLHTTWAWFCVKLFLVSRLTFSITSHTHADLSTPFDSHFTDNHAGSAYFKVA